MSQSAGPENDRRWQGIQRRINQERREAKAFPVKEPVALPESFTINTPTSWKNLSDEKKQRIDCAIFLEELRGYPQYRKPILGETLPDELHERIGFLRELYAADQSNFTIRDTHDSSIVYEVQKIQASPIQGKFCDMEIQHQNKFISILDYLPYPKSYAELVQAHRNSASSVSDRGPGSQSIR